MFESDDYATECTESYEAEDLEWELLTTKLLMWTVVALVLVAHLILIFFDNRLLHVSCPSQTPISCNAAIRSLAAAASVPSLSKCYCKCSCNYLLPSHRRDSPPFSLNML